MAAVDVQALTAGDKTAHHPFRLLASAVVGRPVYISYLVADNARAYTDGERIFLVEGDSLEQQRAQILIQSALIAGGALGRAQLAMIVGRQELQKRYFVLEVERCAALLAARLPASLLRRLQPFGTGLASQSAEHSLSLARGSARIPAPPSWFGSLQPFRLLKNGSQPGGLPINQSQVNALEAQLKQLDQDQVDEDEEEIEKSSFWRLFSSPIGRDGMLAKFLRDLLDMSSAPGKESAEEGASGAAEMVSGKMMRRMRDAMQSLRSTLAVNIPAAFLRAESGAHSYPEWDSEKKRYRSNWVNVEEVEAQSDEELIDARSLSRHGDMAYQRALAGLCLSYQRHRGQSQGDDLVLDRLVSLAVDTLTGHSGDDRIYSASLRTRRDLGVQILLDVSASTLDVSASTRRVFDLQVEAAWRLCNAFSALGDRVAMHGFHSWGRTLVRFQRLKNFDEAMGAAVEQRLKRLSVAGYTRCGAAIRHAVHQLREYSGMPYRLLLVISDGYPYDDQYEGEYAAQDTRRALEEAREQGVACLCLSVGSDADAKRLQQVYGEANYLAIDRSEKLPQRLRATVEAAIADTLRASA